MLWCCPQKNKNAKIHTKHNLSIEIQEEYCVEILLPSHIVIGIDERICSILEYKKEEMIGKDFRPLLLTRIMQKYLLEVYNTKLNMKKLNNIIKEITKIRYLNFLTKTGKLLWIIEMHPVIIPNTHSNPLKDPFLCKTYFKVDNDCSIAPNIPTDFLEYMTNSPIFCVKHYTNCVIIMMDVANSSKISTYKTPKEIALMFHEVIKKTSNMVHRGFYPFIRFVEACGDSLLFLHCPDLSLSLSDIHCECVYFALKLTEQLNKILSPYNTHIRCGMVAGECAGGVWDGKTFRLSGQNVNLAARLEGNCKKNHIVISDTMHQALMKEDYKFSNEIKEEFEDLKGLGVHKMYQINLKPDTMQQNKIDS